MQALAKEQAGGVEDAGDQNWGQVRNVVVDIPEIRGISWGLRVVCW